MPVPTQVSDLSTTIASNSPAGSDNVFPDLDNHIRALAGMLASVATNSATNGYSNPYLPNASAAVFNDAGADIDFRAEGDTDANLLFLDASTDRVGVGTNTPDAKLTVAGVAAVGDGAVGAPSIANTGDLNTGLWFPAADTIAASVGGVEGWRLNSSGNLGLGVTPSAWGSNRIAMQIVGASVAGVSGSPAIAELSANRFINTSGQDIYVASDAASVYQQATGSHRWYTAPSGTAGNAITFTQAMTLDASGNLGVGTTSTSGVRLNIDAKSTSLVANFNSDVANGGYIRFTSSGTAYGDIGTAAEAIGGSASDFAVNARGARNLILGTNNTERARITSGGNLLVGKTADDTTTAGIQMNSAGAITFARNSASNCVQINKKGNTGDLLAFYYNDATVVGTITNTASATAYNTTSDYRLKDFIAEVTGSGERIDALRPIEFTWKADGQQARGFFAHEFQQVYASSVTGEKDAVDEDGKPVYQAMQASTAEVIADLVAEIKSLRARVAALEAA